MTVRWPKVSVVIPVHDRVAFLGAAIDSILAQTYAGPIEIVVVDDGSREDVTRPFRDRYPQVRWIRQENLGVCAARERGARESDGELVAYLDDDDLWMPAKLDRQVRLLQERPDVGLVGSDVDFFLDESVQGPGWIHQHPILLSVKSTPIHPDPLTLVFERLAPAEAFLDGLPIGTQTILIRRSALERMWPRPRYLRDYGDWHDFALRATLSERIAYQHTVFVRIRRGHGEHSTRDNLRAWRMEADALWRCHSSYPRTLQKAIRPALARFLARIAGKCSRAGCYSHAAILNLKAARATKFTPRRTARWALSLCRVVLHS